MSKELDLKNFKVYDFKTDPQLHVAIPVTYCKIVEDAIRTHGSLDRVPNEKTVRGVFVHKSEDVYHYIDNNEQQNDITINQLKVVSRQ